MIGMKRSKKMIILISLLLTSFILFADAEIKFKEKEIKELCFVQVNEKSQCKRPENVAHGRVLCNSVETSMGSKCLLSCDHGYVSKGSEVTICQQVCIKHV